MQIVEASGNFKMKTSQDGGGGGRADIEPKLRLWNPECKYLCPSLPVVLFSQQSRMFLFLIIARPDAKFSAATCWISEKANS